MLFNFCYIYLHKNFKKLRLALNNHASTYQIFDYLRTVNCLTSLVKQLVHEVMSDLPVCSHQS